MKNILAGVVLVAIAFGIGWISRPRPPRLDPLPATTDTLYYPLEVFREKLELYFEKATTLCSPTR